MRIATFVSVFLFFSLTIAATAQPNELVTLVNVRGAVTLETPDGRTLQTGAANAALRLGSGTQTTEDAVLTTGANGSCVLVFPNGITVAVQPETRLVIEEFSRGVATAIPATDVVEEGQSVTHLEISYGEVVGQVDRLHQNSQFQVATPVGVAGIRGTTFVIQVFFVNDAPVVEVRTLAGSVFFAPGASLGQAVAAIGRDVPPGSKLVGTATVDPVTGELQIGQVSIEPVTQAEVEAAEAAVVEIEEAREAILEGIEPPEAPPTDEPDDDEAEGEEPQPQMDTVTPDLFFDALPDPDAVPVSPEM